MPSLSNEDILKRIEKLQLLMLQTPIELMCEWEYIAVEKIKELFDSGLLSGSRHMKWLNLLYKDYKYRDGLETFDGKQILNYRRWDHLFPGEEDDELKSMLRYKYLYGHEDNKDALDWRDFGKEKMKNDVYPGLTKLGIYPFTDREIMRIRIKKRTGDLVMVENPFDEKHSFLAVVDKVEYSDSTNSMTDKILRTNIDWYKQDDSNVSGKSTITEYDIKTNNTLFAESISNLT